MSAFHCVWSQRLVTKKMDYSFKSSLLGEVPHISFKHICQDQSERATQLYIFGIFGVGARCHSIEVTRA